MVHRTKTTFKRPMDPDLVDLCRTMTPMERLQASIQLAEVTCHFYQAGVQFRSRKQEASKPDRRS